MFLWGRSNVTSPLHIFTGHSEAVLEVKWRRYNGGKTESNCFVKMIVENAVFVL